MNAPSTQEPQQAGQPFFHYVVLVAIDPEAEQVVGLTKRKGPRSLVGKLTFPGGKQEAGESPQQSATREMREEAGIDIPAGDWTVFDTSGGSDYRLMALVASSNQVCLARQCEEEPVWLFDIREVLARSLESPESYVSDFRHLLIHALVTLGLSHLYRDTPEYTGASGH